ncbi:AAA-type ATPase lid domain-containing protein, partial [Thiomonas sp.]
GGGAQFPVNVRFMAATHRDLRQAVKNGTFREDLFYRLNVVVLSIPPLRERRKDIIPISEKFLYKSAQIFRKKIHQISPSAKQLLINYDFPGNIRELSNLIERAVLYCSGNQLECEHFPAEIQSRKHFSNGKMLEQHSDQQELSIPFRLGQDSLDSHEQELISRIMAHSHGKKVLAAKLLGISRWALERRIKAEK